MMNIKEDYKKYLAVQNIPYFDKGRLLVDLVTDNIARNTIDVEISDLYNEITLYSNASDVFLDNDMQEMLTDALINEFPDILIYFDEQSIIASTTFTYSGLDNLHASVKKLAEETDTMLTIARKICKKYKITVSR